MSYLTSILSDIDPSVRAQSGAPTVGQAHASQGQKLGQTSIAGANGAGPTQAVKRKAEGQPEDGQAKIQRRDAHVPSDRVNGAARPMPAPNVPKPTETSRANPLPYRGTAGLTSTVQRPMGLSKPSNSGQKSTPPRSYGSKPIIISRPPSTSSKSNATIPKVSSSVQAPASKTPSGSAPPATTPASAPRPGSYAAMLAKAKAAQEAKKTAPPPVKQTEPMKVPSKKERLAMQAEAKAAKASQGKAKGLGMKGPPQAVHGKASEAIKDKKKPVSVGYSGTMRANKSAEPEYKGTARATSGKKPSSAYDRSRSTSAAAHAKSKAQAEAQYGGYADWDKLDDEDLYGDEDEEEDYGSDVSSDMEGGMFDVEEEERRALAAAKREDAEALQEENELKRQKEERKRKLTAMNAAAAGKRRY